MRREPARNRLRSYAITVTRTLFDGWAVVRERGGSIQGVAHQQEAERAALETKIEEARKVMEGRENSPERTAQQRPEPGEQQEHGRGGRTRER